MPSQDTDPNTDSDWHQQTIDISCGSTNSTSQDVPSDPLCPSVVPSKPDNCHGKHTAPSETETETVTVSPTEPSLWNSSRRDKLVLVCLALSNVTSFMSLAIMAPFYPKEANSRGVSDTISGFVFGVFSLFQFATSPLFGKLIPVLGAKFLFVAGMFFGGASCVLFGVLDYIPKTEANRMQFIIFSFLLRITMSLGCTAASTANFAICAFTFPHNAAAALGFLETFTGIGLMLGPALGGVLYDLGGFLTPFAAIGALMIVSLPFYYCLLPANLESEECESVPIMTLLKNPKFMVTSIGIVLGAVIWVVLDPTLEPHLRQFDLSPSVVGLVFLMLSASYAVLAPIWGWLADKMTNSSPLIIIGFYCNAVSMLLLGPSPLLLLEDYQKLWLNLVALLLTGMAISLAVVPTFDRCIAIAEQSGLELNMGTNSAIAGLWVSFYALGEFIGPTAAGVLVDTVGFQWTTTYISGSSAVAGTLMLGLWIFETRCQTSKGHTEGAKSVPTDGITEKSPLLHDGRITPCSVTQSELVMSTPGRISRHWYPAVAGRSRPRRYRYLDSSDLSRTYKRSHSTPYWRTRYNATGYESV